MAWGQMPPGNDLGSQQTKTANNSILANCSFFGGTVPLFEAKKRMILSCVPVFAAIFV